MADESSAVVTALEWTRGGTAVPVAPPAWSPTGGDATLYAYISAHNSYIAAMAASSMAVNSEVPIGEVGLVHDASSPAKRQRQGACAVDARGLAGGFVGSCGSADAGGDGGAGKDGDAKMATATALVVTTRAWASSKRMWALHPVVALASVVLLAMAGLQAGTATATVRARPLAGVSPVTGSVTSPYVGRRSSDARRRPPSCHLGSRAFLVFGVY